MSRMPWQSAFAAMLLVFLLFGATARAAPEHADVRVLIDISGSMRQNDPDNLRRPALRMLAGLLQPGTRAGVWTFARWVNNLVPVAEVDAAWKQRTQSLSDQIGSPGQFTNMEEVLDRASADWQGEPTSHARHLVLLTDGMVDVSKVEADNAASRTRILDSLLPRLQAAGVKVHTIALSERADHALMKRLAGDTGGWYQQVASADELQRVFLRMFETVGKPDAVPLQDNRFVVDGSVKEATVLVFSKPGAPPVVLLSPDGEEFNDSDLPAGVAWFRDQGYDLITIDTPRKGEWGLRADVDPDNRVMIVTDLKLRASEVPAHLAVGEQARIEAYLTNRGERVSRQAFLRLLEVRAEASGPGAAGALPLNDRGEQDDEQAGDGRYTLAYGESQAADEKQLLIAVDSPTFMREKRFRIAVHEPLEARVEAAADGPVLTVKVESAVMQPGATVEAWQQSEAGDRLPLLLSETASGTWQAPLQDARAASFARVSGTSRLGNLIERSVGPVMPPGVSPPAPAQPQAAVEPEPQAAAQAVDEPPAEVEVQTEAAAPPAEPEPVAEPEQTEEDQGGWLMPALMFGGFNLLLVMGGGVWWWLHRRSKQRGADDLDLTIDDATDQVVPGEPSDQAADSEADAPQAGKEHAA